MAHIYRAEISYDNVTVVGPSALEAFGSGQNMTSQKLFLIASDGTTSWSLEVFLKGNDLTPPLSQSQVVYYPRWKGSKSSLDPEDWDLIFAFDEEFGFVISQFITASPLLAGTLAIEKDEAANEIRFITPAGTMTQQLTYTGGDTTVTNFMAQDATPLRFSGHGHQVFWGRNGGGADPPNVGDGEFVDFYDARELTDGGETLKVALSAADPGLWFPLDRRTYMDSYERQLLNTPSTFAWGGLTRPSESAQLTNRFRMEFTWDTTDPTIALARQFQREFRYIRTGSPPSGRVLDATIADEHGDIFVVLVKDTELLELVMRTSYDFGTRWAEAVIYTGTETVENPSVQWHAGKLYVLFEEGDAIKRIVSDSFGETWGAPLTLAITGGSNPVHVVDQAHGTSYIFYIDGTDLKVVSSGNFGETLNSPITVVTDITAQSVAAVVATDGSILVTYVLDGAVEQKKSINLGGTWT